MSIVLDIGGEGRHRDAWSLNPSRARTFGPNRGAPISGLIVGRGDAIPLADRSVRRVLVERAPLSTATVREISRVITAKGTVVLRHVALPGRDRHQLASRILGGKARRAIRQLGRVAVQETIIRPGAPESSSRLVSVARAR